MTNSISGQQIAVITLQIVGFGLLGLLLVTLQVCNVAPRHPVFTNFLVSWVMYSAYATFLLLAFLAIPPIERLCLGLDTFVAAQLEVFALIPLVTTLNMVIHLWFTTRSAFQSKHGLWERWRTPILLISPYLIGLLPIMQLWIKDSVLFFEYFALALQVITAIWDILLLALFSFHHRAVRRAAEHGLLPISLLVKLLVFSVFRIAFTGLSISNQILGDRVTRGTTAPVKTTSDNIVEAVLLLQSLFPILVFILFGLHKEIISLWVPWVSKQKVTNTTVENTVFTSHLYIDIIDPERHQDLTRMDQRITKATSSIELHLVNSDVSSP